MGGKYIRTYETPERAKNILNRLLEKAAHAVELRQPQEFPLEHVLAVHDRDYVDFLEKLHPYFVGRGFPEDFAIHPDSVQSRPFNFTGRFAKPSTLHAQIGYYTNDCSTPVLKGTYAAAISSASVALTGAKLLVSGEKSVYALCRPPGHHAGPDYYGGYCFFNNAAIAAQFLSTADAAPESPNKVAILDIDYHHGNGTQHIFYDSPSVFYCSIHADPNREYPFFSGYADETGTGLGEGYNLNIPLPANVREDEYLQALETALAAIDAFGPKYLVVSVGVDTFENDPIADFKLDLPAYKAIGHRLAAVRCPQLLIQEGGYAVDRLGDILFSFLQPFLTM